MKPCNAWLVLVWGLAAGDAAALSLGSAHGRVLLGRPVDLVFEVQLDPGMELDSACLAAELVSGESPVGRGQVRLQPLPPARGHAPAVRLQTGMLADEPVLTVALSVGCAGKITRSYVFLADLPETVPPSTAPVAIPWEALPVPAGAPERGVAMAALNEGAPASVAPAPARAPAASTPARPPQAVAPAPRRGPSPATAERDAPVRPAQPTQPPAQAASAAASGAAADASPRPRPAPRPRLVMEPLAVVMTKATASAPAAAAPQAQAAPAGPQPSASEPPAAPPQAPASEAASAPAPAPAQGPEPESLRTLKLQEELARMRMQAASDHAAALALQQRVERIESERFHPGVVYGLLALVGLLLAWMAWQVLRFRTAFEQSSLAWSESVAQHERQKNGQEGA